MNRRGAGGRGSGGAAKLGRDDAAVAGTGGLSAVQVAAEPRGPRLKDGGPCPILCKTDVAESIRESRGPFCSARSARGR
jgi:hypothetical protein